MGGPVICKPAWFSPFCILTGSGPERHLMAGTRLRGGGRSLARSGLTRNEKYNGGAAGGGEKHPPGLPSGERFLFYAVARAASSSIAGK